MKNNEFTKNDSLAIKGIAIVIMIFHHLFCEVNRFDNYDFSFSPFTQEFVVNISLMMKICVSIFAFITGYGLLTSIKKIPLKIAAVAKWNIVRLLKTMSGFYFIYIISFIATQLINGLPQKIYQSDSIIKSITYVLMDFLGISSLLGTPRMLATWWYMGAAIIFIFAVPIIYALSKKIRYTPIILVIIILPRLLNIGYPGTENPFSFILALIFGMIFADYRLFEKLSSKMPDNKTIAYLIHFAIFGAAIVLSYFLYINVNTAKAWELKFAIIPIFFICFFRYCIVRIPGINKALEFLGKHSMTIFLTHNFIRYTYLNKFTYSFGNFMVIFIVLLALSILLAVIIDYFKQLIKYDKYFNKLIESITKRIPNKILNTKTC